MERLPLPALAAAVVIGAAVAQPLESEQRSLLLLGAGALFATIFLARRALRGPLLALLACSLAAGALSAWLHEGSLPIVAESRTQRMQCSVVGDVRDSGTTTSYLCEFDAGGPTLRVLSTGAPPALGAHVLLRGRVEPFDGPRNPGDPNERAIENERGVLAQVARGRVLATLPPAPATPGIVLARIHAWALAQLRARLPEPSASILAGELWGERGSLAPDLQAEFQRTGTVHVLVTAGLHLGVVAALLLALLGALRVPRIPACALAVLVVFGYAYFSGMHVPAMRAATTIAFALAARAFGARTFSFNALAAAAIVVALFDPLSVTSVSFALSFSCVGAIVVTAGAIETALSGLAALPHRLREAITLTIATQLGTWPLTAATFLFFAPYAVVANLAVVPCVGATMLLGFAELALASSAPLAQACANLNGWLLAWMVASVHAVAALPGARIVMTPPPLWTIAAYDAAIVAGAWLWARGGRTAALALLLVGVWLVLEPPRAIDRDLRVTALDVGQADSLVIQTPRGHVLLVDAGGRLERGPQSAGGSTAQRIGERIVVPFLLRHGIHYLDAILISHPHGDHAGGVAPVLRALGTGEVADSGQRYGGFAYNDAIATARAERIPLAYPQAGDVWRTDDGVTLRFIGPSLPLITGSNEINDNSIAFMLQYRAFRMLFTGDAGVAAERRFLSEGVDLHAAVLKVGHHGSAYSSSPAFIAAVQPRYAIVSVGRHNLFGHPAPQTLATLRRFGIRVYRTDENGAVMLRTDGTRIDLSDVLPRP
ncbi:MAG: DNA internalization-related competence protein ComEC/Rec2 [Vulcanimicrobiaceae bacterium]